jgi:hypothetical protein
MWRIQTAAPNNSGVAVANGVVYFQSEDGTLYAVNAGDGHVLRTVDVADAPPPPPPGLYRVFGQTSGPSVSHGQVYVGTGDILTSLFLPFLPAPGGHIVALGIDDRPGAGPQAQEASRGQSAAPSRPFTGHGSGRFTDANGGFVASGIATHLGAFTHYGTLILTPTADPTDDPALFTVSGRTTYVAANGDELYAIIDATLNVLTGVAVGTDTWDGGTGRFSDASGTVDITAQLSPDGSFTFNFTGNIAF